MKKLLLLAAVAGVAFSSCVKNETANGIAASASKISFETPAVGASTRAVAGEISSSTAYPAAEKFKVWGWYHKGDYTTFGDASNDWTIYMAEDDGSALEVINQDGTAGTWAPAIDHFWPKNGKLTFAAYSPADAAGAYTHTANGLQIAGFTVAEVGQQYDLLYSDRSYNRVSSTNQYAGPNADVNIYTGVDIVFHHALSSILFKVGTDADYTQANIAFKVKSITIRNVVKKGDFNETLTDVPTPIQRTPTWTPSAVETDKTDYVAFNDENGFAVPADGTTFSEPAPAGGTANDLILLPQSFVGKDDAVVEIVYTMKTGPSNEIENTASFKLNTATEAEVWQCNKRYTYKIIFGDLEKITFAPVVEDWEDVEVPIEDSDLI